MWGELSSHLAALWEVRGQKRLKSFYAVGISGPGHRSCKLLRTYKCIRNLEENGIDAKIQKGNCKDQHMFKYISANYICANFIHGYSEHS